MFGAALALTSGSLAAINRFVTQPSRLVEVAALVAANLAATCLRFVLLRHWVFGVPRQGAEGAERGSEMTTIRLSGPPSPPDDPCTTTVHPPIQRSTR